MTGYEVDVWGKATEYGVKVPEEEQNRVCVARDSSRGTRFQYCTVILSWCLYRIYRRMIGWEDG